MSHLNSFVPHRAALIHAPNTSAANQTLEYLVKASKFRQRSLNRCAQKFVLST